MAKNTRNNRNRRHWLAHGGQGQNSLSLHTAFIATPDQVSLYLSVVNYCFTVGDVISHGDRNLSGVWTVFKAALRNLEIISICLFWTDIVELRWVETHNQKTEKTISVFFSNGLRASVPFKSFLKDSFMRHCVAES